MNNCYGVGHLLFVWDMKSKKQGFWWWFSFVCPLTNHKILQGWSFRISWDKTQGPQGRPRLPKEAYLGSSKASECSQRCPKDLLRCCTTYSIWNFFQDILDWKHVCWCHVVKTWSIHLPVPHMPQYTCFGISFRHSGHFITVLYLSGCSIFLLFSTKGILEEL